MAILRDESGKRTSWETAIVEVLEPCFLATEYAPTFGHRFDTFAVVANGAPLNFAEIYLQESPLKILLRIITYDHQKGMVDKIPDGYGSTTDRRA